MGPNSLCFGQTAGVELMTSSNNFEPNQARSFTRQLDEFLVEMSLQKNLRIEPLRKAFDDVVFQSLAKQYVTPPSGIKAKKNWLKYRQNTMHPSRLDAGQKFWSEHRQTLLDLEKKFQVPAEIIVGILGVETIYGKNMGNFPVRDVLATLAFDYPEAPNREAREKLFRDQLADLITLCASSQSMEETLSFKKCLTQSSSFAGAIGMPQFMPSSLLKYAVDGNADGVIDVRNSPEDAMMSIANFLVQHGWVPNQPILLPVMNNAVALENIQRIADGDPNPKWTLAQLHAMKILTKIPAGISPDTLALIIDLPMIENNEKESVSYWIGLANFETITKYNRSFFYAMAVTEFGYQVGVLMGTSSANPTQVQTLHSARLEKLPLTSNDRHDRKR